MVSILFLSFHSRNSAFFSNLSLSLLPPMYVCMFLHAHRCMSLCFCCSRCFLLHSQVYLVENKISLEPGDGCLFIIFANY